MTRWRSDQRQPGSAIIVRFLRQMRPDHKIGKCPAFTMIWAYLRSTPAGRAAPMTTQFKTEQEYEVQIRNLLRIVSACTLGLWSFAAGLLIGSFYLF